MLLIAIFVAAALAVPRPAQSLKGGLPLLPLRNVSSVLPVPLDLPTLPTLYKLQRFHFTGPYSCIPGYNGSALFVSKASFQRNSPELLYYGNCPPSTPSWYGGAAGVMIDAGKKDITSFSLNEAIYFTMGGGYVDHPDVVQGHTYVRLIATELVLGYMGITVDKIYPDGAADVRWGVYQYQLMNVTSESPGFNWQSHLQ